MMNRPDRIGIRRWAAIAGLTALTLLAQVRGFAQKTNGDVAVFHGSDNGFAELVRAGNSVYIVSDTAHGRLMGDAILSVNHSTLAERRAAVNSPDFREALAQMREALNSTLIEPNFQNEQDIESFGEPIRLLAYFVACEVEVLVADGKTRAAIDAFGEMLPMAEQIKTWGIEGIETGGAVNGIVLRTLARHLDQLSAGDCDRLFGLLRAVLKSPDPAIEGFRAQKNLAHFEVDDAIASVALKPADQDPSGELHYDKFDVLSDEDRESVVNLRTGNSQALADFHDSALHSLSAMYEDLANAYSRFPEQETQSHSDNAGVTDGHAAFVDRFVRVGADIGAAGDGVVRYNQRIDQTLSGRTQLVLAAVHAAILRWRWEHSAPPNNLQVLRLGSLAIDPFTGQPLIYTRIDDWNYTLSSAGPADRRPGRQSGEHIKRTPLTLRGLQYAK